MLRKYLPPNMHVTKVASLARALCILHNFFINENKICCPSEPCDQSNMFMEGGLAGVDLNSENMGTSCTPNVGYVASKRTNQFLGKNYDRINAAIPRNLKASDLSRTKMLQKVVNFIVIEIPVCA